MTWTLVSIVVVYQCVGCGKISEHQLPSATVAAAGACNKCGALVGIHSVRYNTMGEMNGVHEPMVETGGQPPVPEPVHEDKNITPADRDAAAAVGIRLAQLPGGEDESDEIDDLLRN